MAFEAPDQIDLKELYFVLRRRAVLIAGVTVGAAVLFVAASFLQPKRYKSQAQITIYGKYFQNPLVRDLVPDIYDSAELKLQREALIHQALNDSFLDSIGEGKHLYHSQAGSADRTREREEVRKNIEIFPLNATTFQVNFIAGSQELARDGGKMAVDEILKTLVDQRKRTLANVRDAIRARLESMAMQLSSTADPLASARPELLQSELAKTEEEINGLLARYTDRHPQVVKLRNRANWIKKWIAARNDPSDPKLTRPVEKAGNSSAPRVLVGGELDLPTREVYQELLKKYNYLNVGIDMENIESANYFGMLENPELPSSSFAPKRINYLVFGATAGLLLSLFIVLMQEYMKEATPSLSPVLAKEKEKVAPQPVAIPRETPVVPVSIEPLSQEPEGSSISPLIAAAEALKAMTQATVNEALGTPAQAVVAVQAKNINSESLWNAPLLGTLPPLIWTKAPEPLVDEEVTEDGVPTKDDAGGWN